MNIDPQAIEALKDQIESADTKSETAILLAILSVLFNCASIAIRLFS